MRLTILLSLLFLVSCASALPERNIASDDFVVIGEVDTNLSVVKFFSDSGHPDIHHFYLELRSTQKKLIDVELRDIVAREGKKKLNSYIRRISLGKYEIEINQAELKFSKLKFKIQGQTFNHKLVGLQKPSLKNSSMIIVSNESHRLKMQFTLKDKRGAIVDVQHGPDIIFTGMGEASVPRKIKKGVFEFEITYPEENQIIYVSVRANGVLLEKIFRFQYVEK